MCYIWAMWLWRNILLFSNWYQAYFGSLRLKLRAGPWVQLHHRGDIAIVWEVFGEERYGCIKEGAPEVIVDLGAHIGSFSLYAHNLFPKARIYAYEPASEVYDTLIANVGSFATVSKQAVADAAGSATFYIASGGIGSQSGLYSHEGVAGFAVAGTEEVKVVTLDSIVEKLGKVDFLKIDIEDAEIGMLKNSTMLDRVKRIVVEGDEPLLISILSAKGFDTHVVSKGHVYATNRIKK